MMSGHRASFLVSWAAVRRPAEPNAHGRGQATQFCCAGADSAVVC
jgi:hypothetical protein